MQQSSRDRTLLHSLLTVLLLTACDLQAATDYRGEPIFTLKGTVSDSEATLSTDLGPTLIFQRGNRTHFVDAQAGGAFPAQFSMRVFEPPSFWATFPSWYGGDPELALAYIVAATSDHPFSVSGTPDSGEVQICNAPRTPGIYYADQPDCRFESIEPERNRDEGLGCAVAGNAGELRSVRGIAHCDRGFRVGQEDPTHVACEVLEERILTDACRGHGVSLSGASEGAGRCCANELAILIGEVSEAVGHSAVEVVGVSGSQDLVLSADRHAQRAAHHDTGLLPCV